MTIPDVNMSNNVVLGTINLYQVSNMIKVEIVGRHEKH